MLSIPTEFFQELEKDLGFLDFVQSDDFDNIGTGLTDKRISGFFMPLVGVAEQFYKTLAKYHPMGEDCFNEEIADVISLINDGDHFQYFFTDRDGTLKSYSCSYPSSIQPAYSGVIQARERASSPLRGPPWAMSPLASGDVRAAVRPVLGHPDVGAAHEHRDPGCLLSARRLLLLRRQQRTGMVGVTGPSAKW